MSALPSDVNLNNSDTSPAPLTEQDFQRSVPPVEKDWPWSWWLYGATLAGTLLISHAIARGWL